MKVFVTGAAGFIGRAVVQELINNSHEVLGLARSEASRDIISKLGAEAHSGDLDDIESLRNGAQKADGVIHLAFIHDFSDLARALKADRDAIQAMAEAMDGTGKPLVIASGTLGLPKGTLVEEDAKSISDNPPFTDRAKSEDLVFKLSEEKKIRGMVIRLAPTVHGKDDWGFIPMLRDLASKSGYVTVIGDGSNRWPAVHRLDAAVLFRLALEKGKAGSAYHAVAEQGVPLRDSMGVIGKHLQLPIEGKTPEEAQKSVGFFATMIALDNPVSSEKTQKELSWKPAQPGLLDDIAANYF